MHDLGKKISELEKMRYQYSQDVEVDGANSEVRTRLLNVERNLSEIKKILNNKQTEYNNQIKELRKKFIAVHNEVLSQVKHKLMKLEKEKETLRSELIPELEKKLELYNDKKKKLDLEIISLITKITELEKEGEQWLQKM
jgi:hypothetical protein